jgi:hypothetical protein
MRIPNKFNGYSADNRRIYNDPVTLTALATQAGGLGAAGAALGTAGAAAGTGAALGTAAAATIPELAGAGALGSMVGTGEGLAATLPQITGSASTLAQASPEIAANLASGNAQGIMQGAQQLPGAGGPPTLEQMQAMGQQFAANSPAAGNPEIAQQLTASTSSVAPNSITAAPGTPPPTPGTPSMPNVPTQLTPEQLAEGQRTLQMQNAMQGPSNADIASKVASQSGGSNGIMNQLKDFIDPLTSGFQKAMDYAKENPKTTAAGLYALSKMTETKPSGGEKYAGSSFDHEAFNDPMMNPYLYGANGGIMSSYADGGVTGGGPVEQMSRQNAVGANTQYPMADQQTYGYAPQRPISQNMLQPEGAQQNLDPYTGMPKFAKGGMTDFQKMLAEEEENRKEQGMRSLREHTPDVSGKGIIRRPLSEESSDPYTAAVNRLKKASQVAGIKMYEMPKLNMPESFSSVEAANGGIMRGDLGGYSDGGRLLKGPGDGVSDSIPAVIGNKQPARLADGEFVVPARIVSELGNGSTEAGARKLYAMMERIQKGRRKSVGKNKVAVNSKSDKHLPA